MKRVKAVKAAEGWALRSLYGTIQAVILGSHAHAEAMGPKWFPVLITPLPRRGGKRGGK